MSIKLDSLPVALPGGTTFSSVITSRFGSRHPPVRGASSFHRGLDIAFAGCNGKPVFAVAPGKVTFAGLRATEGNLVIIEHLEDDGKTKFWSYYCHMQDTSLQVTTGQQVAAQTVIGALGSTGASSGPHLHFMIKSARESRQDGFIDPTPYLSRVGIALPVNVAVPPGFGAGTAPATTYGASAAQGTVSSKISGLYSFHPHIQYELSRRRKATETANAYMPYVKLTSLVHVLGDNIVNGGTAANKYAYCPTLGVHGEGDNPVMFSDIYTPSSNRSIVGYATKQEGTTTRRVPVVVNQEDIAKDPPNIPPPGIVSMNTERSTAGAMGVRGGLFKANIKIVAYSVGQMNALLRYFLRPATRVVLELGRQSSSGNEVFSPDDDSSSGRRFTAFDWKRPLNNISEELEDIVRLSSFQSNKQQTFLQKYVYDNFGNYEIYIGYVVSFKFRYTKSNTYEIDLTVHSAQQFEVPIKLTGARAICGPSQASVPSNCGVLDIEDYFTPTSAYKQNSFTQLLAKAVSEDDTEVAPTWNNHVIKLNDAVTQGGTGDTTYLISWIFFIDMVLNDDTYGLASIFQSTDSPRTLEFLKNSFPKKVGGIREGSVNQFINEYEVGWHKNLRSTDASVMLIDNNKAQAEVKPNQQAEALKALGILDQAAIDSLANTEVFDQVVTKGAAIGRFQESVEGAGISSLTRGIWLNSNAVIDAFTNADTVSTGLNNLITKMNNATQGYWNLQILSNDQGNPGVHIIDMGESKANTQNPKPAEEDLTVTGLRGRFTQELEQFRAEPGSNIPAYLYKFNRKLRRASGTLSGTGSELLDINYEASLPQVIAVQAIAGVGGVAQRGTLAAINIEELKSITLYDIYPNCTGSTNNICVDARVSPTADQRATGYKVLSEADVKWLTLDWQSSKDEESQKAAVETTAMGIKETYRTRIIDESSQQNLVLTDEEKKFYLDNGWSQEAIDQKIPSLVEAVKNRRLSQLDESFKEDVERTKQQVITAATQQNATYINLVKEFSGMYGKAIELISYDKTDMIQKLDLNRQDDTVHAFNSSNLTKTTVDLTLPGIGGISLFEAFAVDRIPDILERGYYIVTRIVHEFTVAQGWITKITGRFRYKPSLGPDSTPTATAPTEPVDTP